MAPPGLEYRKALLSDLGALVDLRIAFMRIVKDGGLEDEAEWRSELSERFASGLASGSFVAWLCLDHGSVVAASGLALALDAPAREELGLLPGEGLVHNMFTLPAYRRRGIAAELLARTLAEARAKSLAALRLQSTEEGRRLYERAGFRPVPRAGGPPEGGCDMLLVL
jgi:GNAT superfamily N-acetyltransferase